MTLGGPKERYRAIGEYGLIGNCRSAALVGLDGSIDWCCLPRFDSPSLFAALLDAGAGGQFAISPQGYYASSQRYVGDTNVLETRFGTDTGVCTLTDCMPAYRTDGGGLGGPHQIIRLLRCHRGTMSLGVDYTPRPDYSRRPVALESREGGVVWSDGDVRVTLESSSRLEVASDTSRGDTAGGVFTLEEGQEALLVLSYQDGATGEADDDLTPRGRLQRTLDFWEGKATELDYEGDWREQVMRSYLVLHLLTYAPTGAIIAAPTTSLPEEIGGVRNWDYRYTWLRDAAFTVEALVSLGHPEEAHAFFEWLSEVCTSGEEELKIMYRVDGETELEEEELHHLEGYQRSRPVRIGNGAAAQVQNDVYGEVLASAYLMTAGGEPLTDDRWKLLRTLANLAATRWQTRGSGIWEVRGGPYHFVSSKVMCWVALDRAVKLAEMTGRAGPESDAWGQTAHDIKEEVLRRGWSQEKQAFVQHYGTDAMDASSLLLPLMGFLPFDDPRVVSTVQRVRQELEHGRFLHRYRPEETDDGLTGGEGAFTLCSLWLVQALARMGEVEEARRLFREVLSHANHLGLFSEMVDPRSGAALGNFPQAFTHIGLILAARECGVGRRPE